MSTCCTGLSKGWWWLLMLLGLTLLYFFMLSAKQVLIENDLQVRVQQKLIAEGINGTKVVLEQHGRDVLLSGEAATEQERNRIIQLAEKVVGVRVVDNGITVPSLDEPTLVLASKQQKIVLSGIFPSQEKIDDLVNEAKSVYGANNVDNQLMMGNNLASPVWLSDSKLLFPVLHSVEKATVTLAKGVPFLSGMVYSEAEKMALHQRVQGLLSMPVTERITINTTIEPADIIARMVNGKLILEGKLASEAEINAMLELLSRPLGDDIITNQLTVSQRIAPDKGRLTLSGHVDNMMHIKLRLAAKDIVQLTRFTLKDRLVERKMPVDTSIQLTATSATKEKSGNNTNTSDVSPFIVTKPEMKSKKAIVACQSQLDQAMLGKNIHFASNKAIIKKDSIVLLDRLVNIIERCKTALRGSEIIISGYTDSKGNARYNEQLSQRRADEVKRYLRQAGIAPSILKAKGFGEAEPIASNQNEEGRAKNRRITFSIENKQLVSN